MTGRSGGLNINGHAVLPTEARRRDPPVADVFSELREQALRLTPDQLGDAVPTEAGILALLMETAYQEAVATLVGVADGTTSLYFSNGGGFVGAGTHPTVAEGLTVLFTAVPAKR